MAVTINASTSAGLVQTADTSGVLALQTNGTTAISIDASQAVTMSGRTSNPTTISVGGATPSTSGAGITFPATQSASSNANTLDDYEEGTWTPTYIAATTNPTITYTFNEGTYVKIGKLVYLSCRITVSTVSGGSGQLFISGMPFNGLGLQSTFGAGALGYKATWVTNGPDEFRIFNTVIECYFQTATGETAILPSNLQTTTDLVLNISYQTT